jgi:glycosyltransferase involved in cell wall biosynthesis
MAVDSRLAGIRCAVVPPAPVPYREPLFRGLAERFTLRVIYQSAASAGWNQAEGWFPREHAYDAVHLPARQRRRLGRTPVVWPRGLERALREFGPDVVVVWEYGPAALRTWAWCRRHGIPLVIFSELTRWAAQELPRPQQRLHRWLAARARGFIAASSAARDRLLALGVPPDAVEVSLQSFDPEPIRAAVAGAAARGGGGPVRVLTVGRLVPDKNVGGLIEAFARAGLSPGEAELHVVGTGPLEGELRELASRLGVAARFAGYLRPDAVPAAYADADVFVLPSVYEPFGVVAREAVGAGLPIVCSRTSGAAGDVAVEGRNALLADPRDLEQLSGALARVVRDDGLREALARASREIDAENGVERSVDAFARAVMRAAG